MTNNDEVLELKRTITPAERFLSRSPYSIVTMVARIKGKVTEEMLRRAVAKVQRRHALLGVRIIDDADHKQWFTSEGAQDIRIEIVRRQTQDDWIKIHAESSRIPFDFDTRPAIRFILVQSTEMSELIILCHHVICDGISLAYLARDMMEYLGEAEREVNVLPVPIPLGLNNFPDDVRQPWIVKALIQRMNRQWVEESVYFDLEDYQTLTRAYWNRFQHEIISIELSEAETDALVARCRAESLTVNSALTTAYAGAQVLVEGKKSYHPKIAVGANLRDRLPRSPGEAMGYYAGAVELEFKYNPNRNFWDNARRFHKNIQSKLTNKNTMGNILNWFFLDPTILDAMHFKKLGGLVAPGSNRYEKLSSFSARDDIVLRLLRRDRLETLERKHWGTAVTNLGQLDFPKKYGDLELDRLIMQPGGGIPLSNVNLVIGAVTCSGKLSLVVEYAREAIKGETAVKIKDTAMSMLLQAHS